MNNGDQRKKELGICTGVWGRGLEIGGANGKNPLYRPIGVWLDNFRVS
jgi:hypothetical protein